jgi:pimeloyl-[acyl-carrier protein] methyl ester esterase
MTLDSGQPRAIRESLPLKTDVVLLPGLHGSRALWASFAALAPPWASCLSLALPTVGEQSFDGIAGSLGPELRSLEGFVLVGESFSGPIAARLAARLGQKVALTVLCNPLVEAPFALPVGLATAAAASRRLPVWCAARALTGGDRPLAKVVLDEVHSLPKEALRKRLAAALSATRDDLVPFLSAPLLVILGTRDRLVSPALSRELLRSVPSHTLADLDGPHLIAQTRPAEVWKAISDEFETAA